MLLTSGSTFLRCTIPALAALLIGSTWAPDAEAKKPRMQVKSDAEADLVTYGQRDDVMRFAAELAERRGLDAAWVKATLAEARYVPNVAKFIMPPPAATAKNWAAYRARFVEPLRIRTGLAFWRENEKWLQRAEETYGVPPEVIVGVVGVETLYGRHMGNFRVLDALATLSFDFPTGRKDRSAFFRDELEQLFVLAQAEKIDPRELKGSYAGAMGMGQFMPSSWNKYAIDFDGDGHVDLHGSPADVIGSIARYLAEFGWQRGMPPRFDVAPPVDPENRAALLEPDIKPTFTARQFSERGAGLPAAGREFPGLLALVELFNGDAPPSYVAGTANFYAVTRYNWSSYYAMAVLDLGEAIGLIKHKIDR
ncbi:lytic murein transglycosylase B [Piscinibacter gummiphilus]|uniref:Lytic murein transglycosylase B n=1 Tax=Piscinibacter gummiphilus TaxID=946333 RepID=A0ABZ0CZH0_9BURK|nr:lytic murein transglycosylase B [Piscinibacter gummiphilus]WOB10313.1 lytic murein transglycosylase B [Piscinibacter gummiphilus]